MNNELEYLCALGEVLEYGERRGDRTGTGTRSIFGMRMEFDLTEGFPLLTTKKIHFKSVVEELLWMLRGQTNVNDLDASIWNEWADEKGDLGPVYGEQWRSWSTGRKGTFVVTQRASNGEACDGCQPDIGIDQITTVIEGLRNDPEGRRHIVSAWNVAELDQMALPPCHMAFQFYVSRGTDLVCQLYQRSADMFLGVPFNIASYALLTHIIAHYTGYRASKLIWVGGDCHVYNNHVEAVETQLDRRPSRVEPQINLCIPEGVAFDQLKREHFELVNYEPQPAIAAEVAV